MPIKLYQTNFTLTLTVSLTVVAFWNDGPAKWQADT